MNMCSCIGIRTEMGPLQGKCVGHYFIPSRIKPWQAPNIKSTFRATGIHPFQTSPIPNRRFWHSYRRISSIPKWKLPARVYQWFSQWHWAGWVTWYTRQRQKFCLVIAKKNVRKPHITNVMTVLSWRWQCCEFTGWNVTIAQKQGSSTNRKPSINFMTLEMEEKISFHKMKLFLN
jgi:hypothetical protein